MLRTVVLLSGGLDSAVNLKIAAGETEVACALTFDYNQRAAAREIEVSRNLCADMGIDHKIVEVPWLAAITKTALVDPALPLPQGDVESLDDPDGSASHVSRVWVPNRNGIFVAAGAAFAESLDAHAVVGGFNAEEGAHFPDNSEAFLSAANRLLGFSTRNRVKVISFTASLTKTEIVRKGIERGVPLDRIWSCYEGGSLHCMKCTSCLRLGRALREAGEGIWETFPKGSKT
ncbi:MAG: 7-cyano-7-deazaguanine synthase QueC [Planctomycetota bacterium]|jgi:7-cyano-7-deazaguanine synthase